MNNLQKKQILVCHLNYRNIIENYWKIMFVKWEIYYGWIYQTDDGLTKIDVKIQYERRKKYAWMFIM